MTVMTYNYDRQAIAAEPTYKDVAEKALHKAERRDVDPDVLRALQAVVKSPSADQPFRNDRSAREFLRSSGVATGPMRDDVLKILLDTFVYDF